MEKIVEYRKIAAALRREAATLTLARARQIRLQAAERWEALAAEVEMVIAPSQPSGRQDWIF